MKRLILFLLLGLSTVNRLLADAGDTDWNDLRRVVNAEMGAQRIPGAAIIVIVENRVAFTEGFGLANVATASAVTSNTRFRVGSLTKMFTAATVLSLASTAESRIDLRAPIQSHLPDLTPRLGALTLDQLLRHEAGLVDRIDGQPISDKDLFTVPEHIFSYSNLGYTLIGQVAASAAGNSFESLLATTLFERFGMTATSYEANKALDTIGYRLRRGRAVPAKLLTNSALQPAGLLWSSAADLARFTVAFMDGTLDPGIAAQMATPRADVPGESRRYGYGAIVDQEGNDTVVYHMGDEPGGSSFLKMVPAKKCAVIVLTNLMGRLPDSMATALKLACKVEEKEPEGATAAALPTEAEISELVGEYDNSFGLRISRKGRGIVLGPPFPWYLKWIPLDRKLLKLGTDRYGVAVPASVSAEPIRVEAVRDERGKVEFLFMRGRAYKRVK